MQQDNSTIQLQTVPSLSQSEALSLTGRAGRESAIFHYFPTLTADQQAQFAALDAVYHEWNAKINVISRKDIDNLYEHHVLHSLGIAKVLTFRPSMTVLDLGTGGGFPGIPLAILFPDTHFHLVDSVGKKIRVCNEVIEAVGLKNVTTQQARAEELKQKFDFVVSRAVMPLADLVKICRRLMSHRQLAALPGGLIALKGGELEREAAMVKGDKFITPLSDFFTEEYFQTKKVVYVPLH